jgi:hypothetical protein
MTMKVYVLRISSDEYDAEGKDCDEWFETLRDARHRRENLIAEAVASDFEGMRSNSDFEIESVEIANLPRNELVLALLNRKGFIEPGSLRVAVPEWVRTGKGEA